MNMNVQKNKYSALIIMLLVLCMACAAGTYLKTETARETEMSGDITLILYGAGYLRRVAFFDVEGDDYTFQIMGAEEHYIVERSVPADRALEKGVQFIAIRNSMRKILDDTGKVIGYELRPLYHAFRYGLSDVLDIDYMLEDMNVSVSVGLKSSVEKMYYHDLFGGE